MPCIPNESSLPGKAESKGKLGFPKVAIFIVKTNPLDSETLLCRDCAAIMWFDFSPASGNGVATATKWTLSKEKRKRSPPGGLTPSKCLAPPRELVGKFTY
jgi:hypothetical protein